MGGRRKKERRLCGSSREGGRVEEWREEERRVGGWVEEAKEKRRRRTVCRSVFCVFSYFSLSYIPQRRVFHICLYRQSLLILFLDLK